MNLKHLRLTNLRAFEQAEFDFNPGMNLLVGVNGVGKSTVLDALTVCLSRILPEITASQSSPRSFAVEDIRGDKASSMTALVVQIGTKEFGYVRHQQRESIYDGPPELVENAEVVRILQRGFKRGSLRRRLRDIQETREVPDRDIYTPELSELQEKIKTSREHPIGVYFSTRRSMVSDVSTSVGPAAGGQAAAFSGALASRELRLTDIANWMQVQEVLAAEGHPRAGKHLQALRRAAKGFLPDCRNLRAETSPKPRLLVEKEGNTLDARQLSDGERGLLSLVLDLARRLSQANPDLSDPVKHGAAIVLIDELDLHLHPKWQRTIVELLLKLFPRCQFVATTHSPQIVAAVEPEQVLLLTMAGIIRPDRTFGMDSNWILRNLMEADDRPKSSLEAIRSIEAMIRKGLYVKARSAIARAKARGLDLPEWTVLEARMARFEVLAK